jgi:hypothetical protein
MNDERAANRKGLWIEWIIANVFGLASGALVAYAGYLIVGGTNTAWPGPGSVTWLLMGAIVGACLGLTQRVALAQKGYVLRGWIRATTIGFALSAWLVTAAISLWVFRYVEMTIQVLFIGLAFAIPLATAQWLILRKHFRVSGGVWLFAHVIGGGLMLAVSASPMIFGTMNVVCFAGPILFGIFTGAGLVAAVRRPIQKPPVEKLAWASMNSESARVDRRQNPLPPASRPGKRPL